MTFSLALIGAGVRGTAALGRVAARLRDRGAPRPIDIHVIDPAPPGAGSIWRIDQPCSLVMNTVAAQSTVFDDASLGFDARFPGPNFAEWCAGITEGRIATDDPWVRAQARSIVPWASPPRALYGAYLTWAFAHFANALPSSARLQVHADRATAITARGRRYRISLAETGTIDVDAALLALGWLPREQRADTDIAPGSPIDQRLDRIAPGERVGVRGLGMGFIDLLSLVSEERGGVFEADPESGRPGALRYRPSGEEPIVLAGSRSGLPLLSKPSFGTVPPPARFVALDAATPGLLARKPLDFATEVLPLIERDAAAEHYRALAEHSPESFASDPRRLLDLLAQPTVPVAGPGARAVTDSWRSLARDLVPDPKRRFAPERITEPLVGKTPESIDAEIVARLEHDAAQAALGFASPLKRGLHVYQAARAAIIPLTDFAGATPPSRPALEQFLTSAGLAGSGPPLFRTEQLLALHRAGIVRFVGPDLEVVERDGTRFVRSRRTRGPGWAIDRLVDARLDLPDPHELRDPLIASLLEAGLARIWPGDTVAPASARPTVEIRAEDSALIAADGTVAPGLHSVGPLHEELRRFTIIAPIPNARSTVLREIDHAVGAMLERVPSRADAPAPALQEVP